MRKRLLILLALAICAKSREAGATHDCAEGRRLATFPITIWHTSDLTDLTIDINPDDFVPQASSQGSGPGPNDPCDSIRYSSFKNQCAAMAYVPNSAVFWVL